MICARFTFRIPHSNDFVKSSPSRCWVTVIYPASLLSALPHNNVLCALVHINRHLDLRNEWSHPFFVLLFHFHLTNAIENMKSCAKEFDHRLIARHQQPQKGRWLTSDCVCVCVRRPTTQSGLLHFIHRNNRRWVRWEASCLAVRTHIAQCTPIVAFGGYCSTRITSASEWNKKLGDDRFIFSNNKMRLFTKFDWITQNKNSRKITDKFIEWSGLRMIGSLALSIADLNDQ